MVALNDPVGTASASSMMDELPQEFPKVEVIDTLTIDVVPSTSTTSTRVAMHNLPDGLPKVLRCLRLEFIILLPTTD